MTTTPSEVSFQIDDATRERISKISTERKKSLAKGSAHSSNRKAAVFQSTGKWASPFQIPSGEAGSSNTSTPVKKKKSTRKKDDISVSDHARPAKTRSTSAINKSRTAQDKNGLGDYFGKMDETKSVKRKGARSVASVPVTSREGRPSTIEEQPRRGRSKSPHGLKKRTQSPHGLKKRTASPGPMKKKAESSSQLRRRSTADAPMKKRSESPGPMKKRSESPGPMKRRVSTRGRTTEPQQEEAPAPRSHGMLGKMLGRLEDSVPKRKGARSVASAPVVARTDKEQLPRRARRSSRGPLSTRKSRATEDEEPVARDMNQAPTKPRRTKSADESTGLEYAKVSRRAKKPKSIKKSAETGSDQTATTGESSSPEHEQPAKMTSKRTKPMRALSAAQPAQAPAQSSNKIDRRAQMAKQKRNNSMQPNRRRKEEESEIDIEDKPLIRSQSMMLHRDMTRRGGKSNSLADLVNYSEEEIHSTSYFASLHVLVNRDRMKRGLRPLTRNVQMDELARSNAKRMAESGGVAHLQATYVGNVLRGESIRAIHRSTMQNKEGRERTNVLNPYFQEFGVGTCKGEDGLLYVCQLFSERLELTITDT